MLILISIFIPDMVCHLIFVELFKENNFLRQIKFLNQTYLEFLVNCSNNSLVPKFLNVRVAIKSLKSLGTYQQCHLSLLHEEIRQKNLI